jgi:tRNA(Ile)-lysidine synthase
MKNLIKKFQNISHQYDLWKKGDKIIIACSGGPDSTCMLDIFSKLQKKYDLKLIVVHVNYGLRGKDSDKDADFVRKLTSRYSLKFVEIEPKFFIRSSTSSDQNDRNLPAGKAGKPGFSGRKLPSENQLREIRYNFFEKIRVKNKFNYIAVGHTLDDQAETFLMRIIRGSGLAGMAAMRHRNGKIIRPLLGITKKEILEYLRKNKLNYRTDKTNKEVPYLRNRIRNKLIPLLEKNYNPKIKQTLYGASLSVAEDCDFMEQISRETYKKNKELSVKNVLKQHPAMQKRIILEAIESKKGGLKNIESSHIEEILKALKSNKSKSQTVKFKGLKLTRKGDKIILSLNV